MDDTASDKVGSESDDNEVNNSLSEIQHQYNLSDIYQDKYVSSLYWLIGKEYVVEAMVFDSFSQIKAIRLSDIERIESSAFEDFISFEKKGENKIRRIGKREKMKIQQL